MQSGTPETDRAEKGSGQVQGETVRSEYRAETGSRGTIAAAGLMGRRK
jgi:hypothetical protein